MLNQFKSKHENVNIYLQLPLYSDDLIIILDAGYKVTIYLTSGDL